MRWRIEQGDLLDVSAEVLVCSANLHLALSGGVGGAFLLRYGPAMQAALDDDLAQRDVRHVPSGTVVEMLSWGGLYRAVLHAVAVDDGYASSPTVVAQVSEVSLTRAAAPSAQRVALPALATGYGHLKLARFAKGLREVMGHAFRPLRR